MILRKRTSGGGLDDLHAIVAATARDARLPGLSVAVTSGDDPPRRAATGWADLAARTPATPATSYLWFSMTKLVTATAAMRLVDEGRLDLDAPVTTYVGDLRSPRRRPPSTRELLTHTAGLANPLPLRWVHPAGSAGPAPDVLLHRLWHRPRAFRDEPGGRAHYSNVGYLAAAQVIAAAAGQSFEEYVHAAVLGPVGMTRTGFGYRDGVTAATGYVRASRATGVLLRLLIPAELIGPRHHAHVSLRPFYVDGAGYGGLVGDVGDAVRFARMHLNDGEIDGRRILEPGTARAMRRVTAHGRHLEQAIGWMRRPVGPDTGPYSEHLGAGAGFWNAMRIYPERKLGIVMMANTTAPYDYHRCFERIASLS
jgi:CubicO group peptidase (beta-lactamase class C family)